MEDIHWVEYLVFAVILLASTATGVYFGCFQKKSKKMTTHEYLLAGGNMSSIPVALSLLCSMVSSIALLGYPMELYLYGTQYMVVVLAFIPLGLSLSYLYIPVFFNLKVSSAYEYIEIRFNSKLRLLVSTFSIVHLITLMSIAVYAPSLVVQLVTGINSRISTAVICIVCIFYSTLGGLRAVLWADVLQGLVMLISIAVIAGKGAVEIGGMGKIWSIMEDAGRVKFFNFDVDSRTRHTVWTSIVGGYFVWLPTYASTQLQVQRYLALPSINRARRAIVMNFVGLTMVVLLCCLTGMVMLATYINCDPLTSKIVLNPDQMVPYFAREMGADAPGVVGLFVSGIICASMSTMSSGLTALASVTTYDYVKKLFPKLPDERLSYISKINTLIVGVIVYVFIFAVEQMGSILPAVTSLSGLLVGPTLGLFTLGMQFPPSTSKGGFLAMIVAQLIMVPYTVCQYVYRLDLSNQRLDFSTSGCNETTTTTISTLNTFQLQSKAVNWKERDDSLGIRLLSLSYMWHSALTCCITVFLGIIFSLLDRKISKSQKLINSKCISPPIFRIWKSMLPSQMSIFDTEAENEQEDSVDHKNESEKI